MAAWLVGASGPTLEWQFLFGARRSISGLRLSLSFQSYTCIASKLALESKPLAGLAQFGFHLPDMPMGAEISSVLFIDPNSRRSLFWHVLSQRRFRAQSFFMTFWLHVMAKDASPNGSPFTERLEHSHRTLLETNETIYHTKELFIGKAIVCMEIEEEKSMAPYSFPSRFWDFVGASTTTLYVCSEWPPLGQEMRSGSMLRAQETYPSTDCD